MSQKENDKGFYIFAMGSIFMAVLAVVLSAAILGNWSSALIGAVGVVFVSMLIYFFPKIKMG